MKVKKKKKKQLPDSIGVYTDAARIMARDKEAM
jgi:hypothetical protein